MPTTNIMGIPHNRPLLSEEDIDAVVTSIRSQWIAPGAEIAAFEAAFEKRWGGGKACAVSSGTAALYIALKGLGVDGGARVALPTYACSALLNAVAFAGGTPVLVDVREDDFCIDADAAAATGARHVVAVHTFGALADIKSLKRAGMIVVEDCCHGLGGTCNGRPIGDVGDAAIFSFYATKIITCGQGGLVWDRRGAVGAYAADFIHCDGRQDWKPRFNLHLTDFQGAMLRRQFDRLPEIAARRRAIVARYAGALPAGLSRQRGVDGLEPIPYRFVVRCRDARERGRLSDHLATANITTIIPIERFELLHRYLNQDPSVLPVAERLADTTLSLPLYPALSDAEVDAICAALCKFKV